MADTYMLDASGKTMEEAQENLGSKQYDLAKKLGDVITISNLSQKTRYFASYTGKKEKMDQLVCPAFTIVSTNSWEHLKDESLKRANGGALESYNAEYRVERTFNLTQKQMEVATGRASKSPTSGPNVFSNNKRDSYLIEKLTQ